MCSIIPEFFSYFVLVLSNQGLAVDRLGAILFPVLLKILSVFRCARCYAHKNAALLDSVFVVLDAFFRNACANQKTNQAARCTTCACAGDRRCERTGNEQTQTR